MRRGTQPSSSSLLGKAEALKSFAIPVALENASSYDSLLAAIGDAPIVMIGEASHGTKEFYHERAEITRRLIQEKGFNSVIVEADWPDAYRANRYVCEAASTRKATQDRNADEALHDFTRFPTWMWRNTEVAEFLEWLRGFNRSISEPYDKVGFYGMDMYSLVTSAHEVIRYLEKVDSKAALDARKLYSCFMQYGDDTQAYGMSAALGLTRSCEDSCIRVLTQLKKKADDYISQNGFSAEDELFYTTTNAEVVRDAEEYYRRMMFGGADSWNLRDTHMVNTILSLHKHRSKHGRQSKIVVWAHNSHLGDARATAMGKRRGEHNVGQLLRQRVGMDNTFNIGFTTYTGTVSAATDWDGPRETKRVNPGRDDSYEGLFHRLTALLAAPNFMFLFNKILPSGEAEQGEQSGRGRKVMLERQKQEVDKELTKLLGTSMLERYIGVIYRPDTELMSHYSRSTLSEQYDAVIHIDETSALPPLDPVSHLPSEEPENVPETFPEGV
ncbi:Erythromycin esterase [Balamuthia mandrillaris]